MGFVISNIRNDQKALKYFKKLSKASGYIKKHFFSWKNDQGGDQSLQPEITASKAAFYFCLLTCIISTWGSFPVKVSRRFFDTQ